MKKTNIKSSDDTSIKSGKRGRPKKVSEPVQSVSTNTTEAAPIQYPIIRKEVDKDGIKTEIREISQKTIISVLERNVQNENDLIKVNEMKYKPFPSVDELKKLDLFFNGRNSTSFEEANKIYQMIFNEPLLRGNVIRASRKWKAFIGDMLKDE